MRYSSTRISPAKMNNLAGKALVKSPKLRKSQQKVKEACQTYFMQLRSGLTIEKRAYYIRKKTINGLSPKAESSFSLSTYNDQSVTFVFEDGGYEIYVEDLGKNQEKDKVLFRYYGPQLPGSVAGDDVDGQKSMVSLSPTKDKDFLLRANNEEYSVEIQKCENTLPDQTFFVLHKEPWPPSCVSFECKSNPGVFLGVKDNQLALIQKDQTEHSGRENIIFKIS